MSVTDHWNKSSSSAVRPSAANNCAGPSLDLITWGSEWVWWGAEGREEAWPLQGSELELGIWPCSANIYWAPPWGPMLYSLVGTLTWVRYICSLKRAGEVRDSGRISCKKHMAKFSSSLSTSWYLEPGVISQDVSAERPKRAFLVKPYCPQLNLQKKLK